MSISENYGGYGGVNRSTKYVPPSVSDYTPHPSFIEPKTRYIPPEIPDFIPQPATIPFTNEYRSKLQRLTDENGPIMNVNNILLKTRTDDLTGITDRTFAVMTSGMPQHVITYTMPASSVAIDLLRTDGGLF